MKLCYFANAESLHTHRWIKYFAEKGHEVHLVSYMPLESKIDNVKFHKLHLSIPKRLMRHISLHSAFSLESIQFKNLLKIIEPDVLHAHYAADYGIIGSFTNFHPFILSTWGSDILLSPKKSKQMELLIRKALNSADIIITQGDNMIQAMIQLGANYQKIRRISHGVDMNDFNASRMDPDLKKKLCSNGSPIIVSTRYLKKVYNVETLIHAAPLILDKVPDARILIIGDGKESQMLKDLSRTLNVSENITFTGEISHDELPKYLASSDIYVSTSLSDAEIAVSTKEAMACGIPPVITDVADNEKWVKDGVNGFVFPKKDYNALAQKILILCNNSQLRDKFSRINTESIKEKANYKEEMEKMEKIYLTFGRKK